MAKHHVDEQSKLDLETPAVEAGQPLWELNISKVDGHNIETVGRKEVNKKLLDGWRLLHIYTLRYREDGIWRERPMAILGKPSHR